MRTMLTVALLGLATTIGVAAGIETGTKPPEIKAEKWLNANGAKVTLASLTGKVVVVEFWATWCPPCRKSIPHIVELYGQYKDKDLVVIGLTSEDYKKAGIDKFVKQMKMEYIVGTGSTSGSDYGVTGIPTAFIIGKDGTVVWSGHPLTEAFAKKLGETVGGETAPSKPPATPAAEKPKAKPGN